MTSDLRAAALRNSAERVLESNGWYCDSQDAKEIAEHILEIYPPDGETEIDEAWLVSVGGERRADGKWFDFRFRDAGDNEQLLTWYRHGIAMIGDRIGLRCKTRSDLRGLCEKLGIPLKEEKV